LISLRRFPPNTSPGNLARLAIPHDDVCPNIKVQRIGEVATMMVRQWSERVVISGVIPCLLLGIGSLGGCSSEVGTAASGKDGAGKTPAVVESSSERSKGSSKAVEKLKSIKSRTLGSGGER